MSHFKVNFSIEGTHVIFPLVEKMRLVTREMLTPPPYICIFLKLTAPPKRKEGL